MRCIYLPKVTLLYTHLNDSYDQYQIGCEPGWEGDQHGAGGQGCHAQKEHRLASELKVGHQLDYLLLEFFTYFVAEIAPNNLCENVAIKEGAQNCSLHLFWPGKFSFLFFLEVLSDSFNKCLIHKLLCRTTLNICCVVFHGAGWILRHADWENFHYNLLRLILTSMLPSAIERLNLKAIKW